MKISSKQLRNHALSQLESLEKRFTELDQSRKRKNYSIKDTLNFVDDWQLFSSSLYQLRGQCSQDDPVYVDIEERSTFLSHAILNWREADKDEHTYSAWKNRYRSIWREHFSLFALCSALFVGSIIVSLLLVLNQPEYGSLLIPNHMLENIISGKRWFDSLNENPFFGALGLAFHNSKVCLFAFSLSAMGAFGGLYILINNAIHFGSVVGFCLVHGFEKELIGFVLSHGPLELSIIVASCFAGLLVGQSFFEEPAFRNVRAKIAISSKKAITVLWGIIPWLFLAAIAEAFISPNQIFPNSWKIFIGVFLAACFWIWSFWKLPTLRKL